MNPNARFNKEDPVEPKGTMDVSSTPDGKDQKPSAEAMPETIEDKKSAISQKPIPEEQLLKDVDLEVFYLTGKMEYSFKIGEKLPIKIKLISTEDLAKSHDLLFSLMNNNEKSYNSVTQEYSTFVVSKVLLKYAETDLSKVSDEERTKFISELPSAITSAIYNKYSRYEATVNKLLSDPEQIKN